MGHAAITHRLRILLIDTALIACDKRRAHRARAFRHLCNNMPGKVRSRFGKPDRALRCAVKRNRPKGASGRTNLLKPGTPREVIATGQCRSGGRHQTGTQFDNRSAPEAVGILILRQIHANFGRQTLLTVSV